MATVIEDIWLLSSGTICMLTGERRYDAIESIREAFVVWVESQPSPPDTWQKAWPLFWQSHRESITPLKVLARAVEVLATDGAKQVARERMQHTWKTRLRPERQQSEPEGLFAQEQGELF